MSNTCAYLAICRWLLNVYVTHFARMITQGIMNIRLDSNVFISHKGTLKDNRSLFFPVACSPSKYPKRHVLCLPRGRYLDKAQNSSLILCPLLQWNTNNSNDVILVTFLLIPVKKTNNTRHIFNVLLQTFFSE